MAYGNITAIAQINKFGGTRSQVLLYLTVKIWDHCLQAETRLKSTYVSSQFSLSVAPPRRMVVQLERSIGHISFDT